MEMLSAEVMDGDYSGDWLHS